MNYILSFYTPGKEYNAGSKVVDDLRRILLETGEGLSVPMTPSSKLEKYCFFIRNVFRLMFIPKRNSTLYVVYPSDTVAHYTVIKILRLVKPVLRMKGCTLAAIVIDIDSVRFTGANLHWDTDNLRVFDRLFVHSQKMADLLVSGGYKGEIRIQGLFDYYVKEKNTLERKKSFDVCFAGNLEKSEFLARIDELRSSKVRFLLYGRGFLNEKAEKRVIHKGVFNPDILSDIEGSWGLVWDGTSINGLEGHMGHYLEMNSPHKASMYICAELPLIAPEGSFCATVVREHGLGLVVPSFDAIEAAIEAVSDEEYSRILSRVRAYSARLMTGRNLLDCL
jgi:hypothetical protein